MRRTIGMRLQCFLGLILILFSAMSMVACGDSTGAIAGGDVNSGGAGGISGDSGNAGGSGS